LRGEPAKSTILAGTYRSCVNDSIKDEHFSYAGKWTASIAEGKKRFVAEVKEKLGASGIGRDVRAVGGGYVLKDPRIPYKGDFAVENDALRPKKTYFWYRVKQRVFRG
jgi:hypothetical protein